MRWIIVYVDLMLHFPSCNLHVVCWILYINTRAFNFSLYFVHCMAHYKFFPNPHFHNSSSLISDRIASLYAGELAKQGTKSANKEAYAHGVSGTFLPDFPLFPGALSLSSDVCWYVNERVGALRCIFMHDNIALANTQRNDPDFTSFAHARHFTKRFSFRIDVYNSENFISNIF